jgi:endonuclease G
VASLVAKRAVDGRGIFMRNPLQAKSGAYIDFKEEVGSRPGQASCFEVLDIPYLADTAAPDVALMRITGHDLPSVLPLADKAARQSVISSP